jgi:A/G-specific adenine glycosylase
LGYYSRARNLHKAAQLMREHEIFKLNNDNINNIATESTPSVAKGKTPELLNSEQIFSSLRSMPGVGDYTAGAIASIAYGKRVPAVDGNVLRVISRVTADDNDITKQSVKTQMEEKLRELMELEKESLIPSIFNQALMELGATVCLPNGTPQCMCCPWKELCEARKQDRIWELPVKKKLATRRVEEKTVLIIKDGEKIALHKRPKRGLLAGLYELPNTEGYLSEEEVIEYIIEHGYVPIRIQPICEAKHIFSHVEWHMKGYVVFLQASGFVEKTDIVFEKTEVENENGFHIDKGETGLYNR